MARFAAQQPNGTLVGQLEKLVRVAVFHSAAELVGCMLQAAADRVDATYQPKPRQHRKERARLDAQGMFGRSLLWRDYYYTPATGQGHYPADAALGLELGYTPALARLICLAAVNHPSYEQAAEHLWQTGGIEISAQQIQRVAQRVGAAAQRWQARPTPPQPCDAPVLYVSSDGTGVPMRSEALAGRKGKQPDGSAKTRQAYLGCVFTQHQRDDQGHPVRDHASTTYVCSFDTVEDFWLILRQEARRRGCGTAGKIVLLLDGAAGLANQGRINFPGCLQIVDFYHAMKHLKELWEAWRGKDHPDFKKHYGRWTKLLLKDGVQQIIAQAREGSAGLASAQAVQKALHYFESNVERMRYGTFRKQGYFIGSGVIEAGCKTVIGARCKQSGMFWSESGAENILALRCISQSREWDNFWKYRANEHAARNDTLNLAS